VVAHIEVLIGYLCAQALPADAAASVICKP
jgi:hypothetical protein